MQSPTLDRWRQSKAPLPATFATAERRARAVLFITLATMIAELVTGYITGSMALTADGWHMGSHAAALAITTFAYVYARRHADNERFSFGTGKVSALGGYSSALLLGVVSLLVATESVERLLDPTPVDFVDALLVAVIGLIVNLVSAALLSGGGHHHHHGHGHDHGHDHGHAHAPAPPEEHAHRDTVSYAPVATAAAAPAPMASRHASPTARARHDHHHVQHGHDHNLRAAYLHVVADALTSVLAIGALIAGGWLGLVWLDPLVGIFAAGLIAWWALGLLRTSSRVLLDAEDHAGLREQIIRLIESDADNRVADVRVWSLGGRAKAAIIAIVTHRPRSANYYKNLIASVPELHHVTTEVHLCDVDPCDVHPPREGQP
jgi:cation diffusion facilitator family transporter